MADEIPVLFRLDRLYDDFSAAPQVTKPGLVVGDWRALGLPIDVEGPDHAHQRMLLGRVHSPRYVRDVCEGKAENGFGTLDGRLAHRMLEPVEAMGSAADYLFRGYRVACAPFGGFQHAHYARAEGGCTFNGLVAAAKALANSGPVGILNFDAVRGNGTADILRREPIARLTYVSAADEFQGPDRGVEFMAGIRSMMRRLIHDGCQSVVYHASVNQHLSAPGIGMLTTEQMTERDRIVFSWLADAKIKVLWCLGDGYQTDQDGSMRTVVELHRNTMIQCVEVFTGKKVVLPKRVSPVLREVVRNPHFPYDTDAGRSMAVALWLYRVCGIKPTDVVPDDVYLLPEPVHLWRLVATRIKVVEAMPQTKEIGMKAAVLRWIRSYLRYVPADTRMVFSQWVADAQAQVLDPRALVDVQRLLGLRSRGKADPVAVEIERELRDKIAAGKAPASLLATYVRPARK